MALGMARRAHAWRLPRRPAQTPNLAPLAHPQPRPPQEAWNDLAFVSIGQFNSTLKVQSGAPIRLNVSAARNRGRGRGAAGRAQGRATRRPRAVLPSKTPSAPTFPPLIPPLRPPPPGPHPTPTPPAALEVRLQVDQVPAQVGLRPAGGPCARAPAAPAAARGPRQAPFLESVPGVAPSPKQPNCPPPRISFVSDQPVNWWNEASPEEYGFWANINPQVAGLGGGGGAGWRPRGARCRLGSLPGPGPSAGAPANPSSLTPTPACGPTGAAPPLEPGAGADPHLLGVPQRREAHDPFQQ
jgi:hypothetical protein